MTDQPFASPRWTVTDLTRYVREMFESDYRLQDVEVEGEISNMNIHSSGHAYFTLKDSGAQLKAVMWRSDVQTQRGEMPRNGDRVIARGRLTVYEARGEYQIMCRVLRPAGLGDLYARLEALKARLQEEGLFAPERKRLIPERPRTIGIVTGTGTAALQDVLNTLRRRYPLARVVVSPALVQGDQAPVSIIAALNALNEPGLCDVILLVRGGGSLEDLWCFNDEQVVRAIVASAVPIISGVGHEIDFTLADFAADLRAPTPTAAAELVTQITLDDLRGEVEYLQGRLAGALSVALIERRRRVGMASMHLARLSPQRQIDSTRQHIDDWTARASRALRNQIALRRVRLNGMQKALTAMSPEATLGRGYAIVRGADGQILRRASDSAPGDAVDIRLQEGSLRATVDQLNE